MAYSPYFTVCNEWSTRLIPLSLQRMVYSLYFTIFLVRWLFLLFGLLVVVLLIAFYLFVCLFVCLFVLMLFFLADNKLIASLLRPLHTTQTFNARLASRILVPVPVFLSVPVHISSSLAASVGAAAAVTLSVAKGRL